MTTATGALDVLDFWWAAGPQKWFVQNDAFDEEIKSRFGELHGEAAAGKHDGWAASPCGALALILVLDQFSRNLYRNDARAFAQDGAALAIAETVVAQGIDRAYPMPAKQFFYMPFMHAEDIDAQQRCVDLFRATGNQDSEYFALVHLDVIRRFGRFPHRNAVLGRKTTPEEADFLAKGGFSA